MITGREKGDILYGYSIATLQDGSKHIEVMSKAQINDVRACSESYKSNLSKKKKGEYATSVWVSNEPEMSRKTIVKRHFKYLPKSDNKQLEKAIELDNEDYDFPATYEQGNYIESLLLNSNVDEKTSTDIFNALGEGMTQKRADECIEYLLENQKDPITEGVNYNQGDISKKLEQKLADPRA